MKNGGERRLRSPLFSTGERLRNERQKGAFPALYILVGSRYNQNISKMRWDVPMQYGHFDNKNREYVIDRIDLPVSWTNYIGQKDMYGVFNHTAGGYLLCGSSAQPFRPALLPSTSSAAF